MRKVVGRGADSIAIDNAVYPSVSSSACVARASSSALDRRLVSTRMAASFNEDHDAEALPVEIVQRRLRWCRRVDMHGFE